MTARFLALAFLSLAYGKEIVYVDLSSPTKTPEVGVQSGFVRGGGVFDGGVNHRPPGTPTFSLKLTRILIRHSGAFLNDVVEVVVTNTGKTAISIPIGDDPIPLLKPAEPARKMLAFTITVGKKSHPIGFAEAASNSSHPESSATLEPGDTAIFLLPAGTWSEDYARPASGDTDREVSVSVLLQRKVIEGGKDWTEPVGEEIHSENTLLLP